MGQVPAAIQAGPCCQPDDQVRSALEVAREAVGEPPVKGVKPRKLTVAEAAAMLQASFHTVTVSKDNLRWGLLWWVGSCGFTIFKHCNHIAFGEYTILVEVSCIRLSSSGSFVCPAKN